MSEKAASDAPVRLAVAAEQFGLTVSALRREARQGRLEIYRVAGKDWTTIAAVREMFERCRATPSLPVSTPAPPVSATGSSTQADGSSSTEDGSIALAAALATARALKERSKPISPRSIARRAESGQLAKFGSPT